MLMLDKVDQINTLTHLDVLVLGSFIINMVVISPKGANTSLNFEVNVLFILQTKQTKNNTILLTSS